MGEYNISPCNGVRTEMSKVLLLRLSLVANFEEPYAGKLQVRICGPFVYSTEEGI